MKVLFDTNVILDILLERENLYKDSLGALTQVLKCFDTPYLSGSCVGDIFYIIRKCCKEEDNVKTRLKDFISIFKIAPITDETIKMSFDIDGKDYEDDMILATSIYSKIDVIVTNNKKHFASSEKIKIMTPKEFIEA